MDFEQIISGVLANAAFANVLTGVVFVAGLLVLVGWFKFYGGLIGLDVSAERRNSMPIYFGFAAVVGWLMLLLINSGILSLLPENTDKSATQCVGYLLYGTSGFLMVALCLWAANKYFCRGLKGFGLDHRTIRHDLKWAFVNLMAIYPMIFLGLIIVTKVMGYDPQKHETLELISGDISIVIKVIAALFAVLMAPILEEILFRGMFQTMVRSATGKPRLAIVMTSVMFVMMHGNKTHWLALFALSAGMGYAYEKSGSLYRSIFIHMMFNGINVACTILLSKP